MTLVKIKEKYQITIPSEARNQIPLKVGDLLEITVHGDAIVLRPKVVMDRTSLVATLQQALDTAPTAEGKSEEEILEEAIQEIKATRAERRANKRGSR